MTTEQQLKQIHEKLQVMLKQHQALLKENANMRQELATLRKVKADHATASERLQDQIDVLKLGQMNMTEEDRKQFEKRINQYVREIDRAIGMLSQ